MSCNEPPPQYSMAIHNLSRLCVQINAKALDVHRTHTHTHYATYTVQTDINHMYTLCILSLVQYTCTPTI